MTKSAFVPSITTGMEDVATTVFNGVEAILFDAGDILYHRPNRAAALAAMLQEFGATQPLNKPSVKPLKLEAWRGKASRFDYYRALLRSAGIADEALLTIGANRLVDWQHEVSFFPGVTAALHSLKRAGFKLGIITNTHETTAEKLEWFSRVGIDGLWDVYVNSCETGLIKPEPEIYQLACNGLGLHPSSCVFVGHSAKEIAGARAVGLRTIAFNPDIPDIGADVDAPTFEALLPMLIAGESAAEKSVEPKAGPGGLPTIAAHRGGALLWPENSLTAFRGAIALHSDLIETDIHLSADGLPIILHDATLDRTTEGTGELATLSAVELSKVRIKGTPNEGLFTLDRLLFLIAPSQTDLRLELKVRADGTPYEGLEAAAIAALNRFSMLERTTISSFKPELLIAFQKLAKPKGLIALVRANVLEAEGAEAVCKRIAAMGIPEIAFSCHMIDETTIAAAKSAGLHLGAFAVRTRDDCDRMLALGITTFTTDIPDYALARRREMIAEAATRLGNKI